jgi:hypothetical protein
MAPPRIVVAGGSGYIGRPLCRALWDNGKREVWALSRAAPEIPYARVVRWDGRSQGAWTRCLEGAAALINLCGEGTAPVPPTAERRRLVAESRLEPTRALVEALRRAQAPPAVFLSASSTAFYGDRGEEALDEASAGGADPEALLCAEWEGTALRALPRARTVALRLGHVLGSGFGALRPLLLPFRLGLGGPIGTGRQYVSWIAREDLIGLILHLLESDVAGPVNATAPEPVTNETFCLELAAALNRRARWRYPPNVAERAFGELGERLLTGQRALPRRAERSGYAFTRAALREAFATALQ